ncbi:multidrug ABC transporter substrate-binding protein [Candidatus Peregrinibacteria bacterium CG22_combo_CG10-13_8_21_14_all_44_10]|nr:MAG: hypothetical protein AUK45_00435 [Candidatus Peregrinibacteria bacterium CG2_30_44_17]PIP66217.1 MAG: multidrug ABC transporter substrate-binding protein [Candidatus Peregrinibacteria bacterium CG22_combo_CG10-13_8_21_14_all_44_10]PIX79640.1 MAG: multidrug ABC transporter substrate-binding protein [Candidatus Peregrinibacteria bacterium CG_4_10_14_3_um_filter_44_21]PJB88278.1 MAG: multidrug ABC transporter substrate-binding protein [Candidatus Peregrinibacteria bacterium CG_4_9_14_0_8_um
MYGFAQSLRLATRALRANKSRAFLTSLGITIGIASVIMVVSIGSGAQSLIINQVKGVGSNLIGILPGGRMEDGPPAAVLGITITTLTLEDAEALSDPANVPNAVAVTAYVKGSSIFTNGSDTMDGFFNGVSSSYPEVEDVVVADGRFFTESEANSLDRIVVIGSQIAEELFNGMDPIGEDMRIGRESFQIIGVLEERGTVAFQNRDDQVFVPVNVAQKLLLGIDYVSLIRVKVDSDENIERAQDDVIATLRSQHGIRVVADDDFTAESMDTAIEMLSAITNVLKFFLAAIAAVSLLIGGIGIMNIMFISVTERTREIGLRKAVGAGKRRILEQFLFESVVVTLVGGFAGIVVGSLISVLVALAAQKMGYDWDLVVSVQATFWAFCVSCIVGIVFGYYPAKKAANLNPIDALRHE